MLKPYEILSLDGCPKRFLWTHKKVHLVLHLAVCFVLQAGYAEEFLWHLLGFQSLALFSVSKQGPCLTAIQQNEGDKRLVQFELACKDNGAGLPDPV